MEGKYPCLPAPKCPKCEKGHLLLVAINHGTIQTTFKWHCSNPNCNYRVGY